MAKKKVNTKVNRSLSESIDLLLVESFIKSKKFEYALTLIEDIDVQTKVNQ